MKEIPRYNSVDDLDASGEWCKWSDVEPLQRELNDLRSKAFALVWCLPEETLAADFYRLREEALGVLLGKDKQIIAKLEDELAHAHEFARRLQQSQVPGLNMVYGMSKGYKDVKHVLMITALSHAPNGGLDIEVQLP